MKKFAFSKDQRAEDAETSTRSLDVFSGSLFYNEYKDATFLRHSDNIETILCKGHELRKMLKEKANPGDLVKMIGMSVTKNLKGVADGTHRIHEVTILALKSSKGNVMTMFDWLSADLWTAFREGHSQVAS